MRELLIGLGIAMTMVLAPMASSASTTSATVQAEAVADKAPAKKKCDKAGKPCKKGKDCSADNCKSEPEPDDSDESEESED
jgi:hypothetical protein